MKCPRVENLRQAIALGQALADVVHFDGGWVERVFQGDPRFTFQTGPDVLNRELESMWNNDWTEAEKTAILAKYVAYRLN